jgi:hypothetical protein
MARVHQATALLTGIAAILASSTSADQARTFVGYAFDLTTGEALYTETHEEIVGADGGGELRTIYTTPEGDTIAVRTVDFSVDPLAPVFHFEDMRTGYREGSLRVNDEVVLYRSLARKTTVEQAVTEPSRQLVVDAGFDRLVATNWDSLVAGEPLVADFAVPSRLTCLTIRVDKKEDGILDGEPVVTFRMRFKNPLLRLVAGPIDVTYHRAERFLMRYEGLSNVSDPRGNNHTVRIDFPIAERRSLAPVEIAEWRAANNG